MTDPIRKPSWVDKFLVELPDDSNHPAQIALRTYALSLSLSLGPALLSFIIARFKGGSRTTGHARNLKYVLRSELGPTGFAFAITVAVGGGAALRRLWRIIGEPGNNTDNDSSSEQLSPSTADINWRWWWITSAPHKAFVCNLISSTIAIALLRGRGGRNRQRPSRVQNVNIPLTMPIDVNTTKHGLSPTLDLTLLLLVRAVDATIQSMVFKGSQTYWSTTRTLDILEVDGNILVSRADATEAQRKKEEQTKWRQKMTTRIDAFIFWACSARSVIDIQWSNVLSQCSFRSYLGPRIMWCFFYEPRRCFMSFYAAGQIMLNQLNVFPKVYQHHM